MTFKGSEGFPAPLTVGDAIAFICQIISFSGGEKRRCVSRTDRTTSAKVIEIKFRITG